VLKALGLSLPDKCDGTPVHDAFEKAAKGER
jgi:hypothetical protein